MVYVEKLGLKSKRYHKLVHTIRDKGRITHKTKYIGKVLPPKERLDQLKKEFLLDILERRYKYLSQEEIELIESRKAEYKKEIKRLSPLEKEKRLKEFIIRFTYDSSKLSGVMVTLRQTFLILKEGVVPKNFKNLKTVRELENHERGVLAITTYKGKFDIRFIKKIHKILFSGVDDSISGKLRDELKRNVKLAGTPYVPPKWQSIKKEFEVFFKWYKVENRKLHPLELASLIHLKIISIQPFADGNSRLSRLLMNWILWKKNYPLVDIPVEDLENYYSALDKYQIERKEKPFIEYIKRVYLRG